MHALPKKPQYKEALLLIVNGCQLKHDILVFLRTGNVIKAFCFASFLSFSEIIPSS